MAKSRAQRKAEQRRRRELGLDPIESDTQAQHDTQVPESGEVAEVEAAMQAGAADAAQTSDAPAPSRADVGRPEETPAESSSRRERKRQEKEAAERAKAQAERRTPVVRQEREHGAVITFFGSVRKELQKVQWPDRDTLVQASAVTLLFVSVAAAYLGALDAIFSRLVDLLIT